MNNGKETCLLFPTIAANFKENLVKPILQDLPYLLFMKIYMNILYEIKRSQ